MNKTLSSRQREGTVTSARDSISMDNIQSHSFTEKPFLRSECEIDGIVMIASLLLDLMLKVSI